MRSLPHIRKQLGLSQKEMAEQLGMTRAMIAKVESKRCRLSGDNLLKVLALEKRLKETCPGPEHVIETSEITTTYCKKRLRNNMQTLYILEKKQEVMQRNSVVVVALTTGEAAGTAHVKRVERRHKNCGACAQEIIKIKIDLLSRENDSLRKYIADLTGMCE